MKKLNWTILIVVLVGAWYSWVYLSWPDPPPPKMYSIALADLDGDGDLDALVGNQGPDEVWWNDGPGYFSDSEQTLGNTLTRHLHLADLDRDGELDAFIGSDKQGRIWLNDGRGFFTDSRQEINYSSRHAATLGDVDGDGTLDVVARRFLPKQSQTWERRLRQSGDCFNRQRTPVSQ